MTRAATFLVCGAMLALSQVRQPVPVRRLEDRIAIDRVIDSLTIHSVEARRLPGPATGQPDTPN